MPAVPLFRAVEHTVHGVCRSLLCRVVEMCIDVCRGGEGTVTQPDLDLLHGDTVAEKQAGAGVTKIMEANLAKPILLDEPREMLRCIVRTQKFSALVNADVVEVVPAVTFLKSLRYISCFSFSSSRMIPTAGIRGSVRKLDLVFRTSSPIGTNFPSTSASMTL